MTVRAYKTDIYDECDIGIAFVFCTPQRKSAVFYQMCKSFAEYLDGGMDTSDFIKDYAPRIWRAPKLDPAAEHFGEYYPHYDDETDESIGQWLFEKGLIVFRGSAGKKIDTTVPDFKTGIDRYEGWYYA